MTTLVTGVSGFVGSAIVRQLLAAGHSVRALVRPSSNRRNIKGLAIDLVTGDLRDPASLDQAIQGCDVLFHVAADYRLWTRRPDELYQTNVEGTLALMQSALRVGVERIVYTSSVATLGLNPSRLPSDEETPVTLNDMIGHYKRSKYLAEEAVMRLIQEEGLPAVIVNPSTPIGPRDIRPTPTGRMVLDAACGFVPAYVDTGLNLVHVDDVAVGHLLAFERGTIGERYILGGENLTLKEIYDLIARITGKASPKIKLPHNLLLPLAYLSEWWTRMTAGAEPRVTVDVIRMAKKFMFFTIDKARRELGFSPRPAEAALVDAIDWFRQNGYCD